MVPAEELRTWRLWVLFEFSLRTIKSLSIYFPLTLSKPNQKKDFYYEGPNCYQMLVIVMINVLQDKSFHSFLKL